MVRPATIAVQRLLLLLVSLAAACGGSDLTLPSGVTPAAISIVRGNNQAGAPGTMLPDSIIVRVVDSTGAPVPGQHVEFAPQSPDAAVAPTTAITDANGRAGARWVLGANAGSQEVVARVSGSTSGELQVSFTATAEGGLPSAPGVSIRTQPSGSVTSGQPFDRQPVVQITDAAGNDLATTGVAVTAAIVSGGGTLGGATTRLTNANGRAEFTDLRIEDGSGPHVLIFAASGYTSAISDPINVEPSTVQKAATTTRITGQDPNPSTSGQAVLVRFTVSSDAGTPTGSVTITASGGNEACSAPVATGSCTLVMTDTGNRQLTATYNGDDRFLGSSDQVNHQVNGGGGGGGGGTTNLPPTAVSDEYNTLEGFDHTLEVAPAAGVLQNDRDPEGASLTASMTSGPQHGRVTLRPDGSFDYTPEHDWFGDDRFTYRVTDNAGNSSAGGVTVHVDPINDSPRFKDRGNPPPVEPDAGTQTIPGWAFDIIPGNLETDQTVDFIVTGNSNPGLFAPGGQPAVSRNGPGSPGGTLTYTPSGSTGSATITIVPRDNGGTANGGDDIGEPHSFTITVRE
jgi:hypothetical protein